MKRLRIALILFFLILPFTPLEAAIVWEADFYQFRYSVAENGGIFYYPPELYFIPNHQETSVHHHDPTQGTIAAYDAVALGNLVEFENGIGKERPSL